jgi:hypothetical protein
MTSSLGGKNHAPNRALKLALWHQYPLGFDFRCAFRLRGYWTTGRPPSASFFSAFTRASLVRCSQVPREPSCTSALLLDPGRTLARGVGRSGAAPADIKAKAPAIRIFRGSITRLLCPLPTLEAVLSGDSPRLASGWWPPFPGGALLPTGFLQRISTFGYFIASFLSGFFLALYD